MNTLYNYIICEVSKEYNIGEGFTIQDCMDYIYANQKFTNKLKNLTTSQIENFLNELYKIWSNVFHNEPSYIPCRFTNGSTTIKIKRAYKIHADQLERCCNTNGIKFERIVTRCVEAGFIIGGKNGLRFDWGDGSLWGSRSQKGLEFEVEFKNNVIKFIETIADDHPINSEQKLNDIFGDSASIYKNIFPIYLEHGFDNLIKEYIRCKKIEYLEENISLTGRKDTKRNARCEIIDLQNLEFSQQRVEDVLKSSGEIVADVTIIPDNTYISTKLETAQLSSINIVPILNNDSFKKLIINEIDEDDIVIGKVRKFIHDLGIDFDSLIKCLRKDTTKLELADDYDKFKLGGMFQKLVGGNYWYTNSKSSIFIPAKDTKLEFNVEDATISKTRKTISIKGQLSGLWAEIKFRTAGEGYLYPYRLFPNVDMFRLANKCLK